MQIWAPTGSNVVMIFLAGVALVAARFGHGPAMIAAVLSVLVFDFFFVPPLFSLKSSDPQYYLDLLVMLGIGILVSELTARLQMQLRASRLQEQLTAELFQASQKRERRTAQLYEMTSQLARVVGVENLAQAAGRQLQEIFAADIVLLLSNGDGARRLSYASDGRVASEIDDRLADDSISAELSSAVRIVPMIGAKQSVGVLAVRPNDPERFGDVEEQRMLETCANLIALSIERDQSLAEAHAAHLQVNEEQLRNSLLSAVSHDLRTPLAMIAVTASSLLEGSLELSDPSRQEMLQNVVDESHRLARQVENLLDMAQFESGKMIIRREWIVLEELVGAAIARLKPELKERRLRVRIPDDFPMLWVAEDLFEQVLINLLENAGRYTPRDSTIEISADGDFAQLRIRIADNGPGLPSGSEQRIFEKFFRGNMVVADGQRGIGLGLTICQSIVKALGGEIRAANRAGGGAEFTISLPHVELTMESACERPARDHQPAIANS